MANLGYVSTLNVNGNELTIKDTALTEVVNEIIEAIGANNTNIAERINDLHNRSFDNTIKISSQNESEIASIQDGLYKLQYVTVTGEGEQQTETLNNSAILIQKGTNQYLYKDGQLSSRTKENNTWGTWVTFEGGVSSVNGITGVVITQLSDDYAPSELENEYLELSAGDTYEEAFGKLHKAILDNEEITAGALANLDERIDDLADVASSGDYYDLLNLPTIPQNVSDLNNDSGFITQAPVTSVNGQTGAVTLDIPSEIITGQIVGKMHRDNVSGTGNLTITGASGEGFSPTGITTAGKYIVVVYSWSDTKTFGYNISFGNNNYTLSTTDGTISDKRELTVSAGALWSGSVTTAVSAGTTIIVEIYKAEKITQALSVGTVALTNLYNDLDGKPTISNSTSSTSTTDIASSKAVKSAYDHGGVQSVNGMTGAVTITIPDAELSANYETSTLTNDDLLLEPGDTHEEAFSKIEKAILDNELVTSTAVNDLNTRINNLGTLATVATSGDYNDLTNRPVSIVSSVNGQTGAVTISETQLSKGTTTGTGNAVTDINVSNHQITLVKGATYATQEDVNQSIASLVDSAPETLNTLNELAEALGNDENFATTVATQIGEKYTKPSTGIPASDLAAGVIPDVPVQSVNGQTGAVTLSLGQTNVIETVKVNGAALTPDANKAVDVSIPTNVSDLVNDSGYITASSLVQSDWNQTDTTANDYIKNKPNIIIENNTYLKLSAPNTNSSYNPYIKFNENGGIQFNDIFGPGNYSYITQSSINMPHILTSSGDLILYDTFQAGPNKTDSSFISINARDGFKYINTYLNPNVNFTVNNGGAYLNTKKLITEDEIPTKTSDLTNDSGFLTSAPVTSVNGATGAVTVKANVQSDWNATTGDAVILNKPTIPAAVTESTVAGWGFTKNTGTLTTETQLSKGTTTGTGNAVTDINVSNHQITLVKGKTFLETAPVTSVNGATGDVTLTLGDTNIIETIKVNNTALTPDVNKTVNIDLSSYDKAPLVIEVDDTDTTVPSGTYTNIGNALANGREVYIKMNGDDYSVYYLKLCSDLSEGHSGDYYFYGGDISCSILSNNALTMYYDTYAAYEHEHGDINNDGTLSNSTPISIANGDRIVITDASSNEKIQKTSITFDGSTTTTALTPKGTWETFLKTAPVTSVNGQTGAVNLTIPSAVTESTVSGWGFTKNAGTITGITMNGASKGTSGVVDLGTVLTSQIKANWNETNSSSAAYIQNKPTIPTVNDSTVTITMNGNTVGTFTLNKSGNTTIDLGTVLTSHQSIKTVNNESLVGTGNVSIQGLPAVTSADNGKVLMVVNGAWQLVSPVSLYSGSSAPSNSQGNNGDIYVQS